MLSILSLRSVPSFAFSNSSNDNVELIDNLGPFSSFQGRLASTSSFYTSLLYKLDCYGIMGPLHT